ncbi:hypothetical protein [Halobacillus litoralis]|uniref:hypothetical protein n=1 Tax=Halobacillus litoralis TaxID=45668 RepID=UPI001CFE5097|nr:hypothetical protein [Halobacillus litoralis]
MSKTYRDYFNQTVLTIPDRFIDVKTGESQVVSSKVLEEIQYHSENNTLQHFILSALNDYFHKSPVRNKENNDLLNELLEIKRMLSADIPMKISHSSKRQTQSSHSHRVSMKEIEDVLEAFGG